MKYDEYKDRILKVKKAKTVAFRFRFLILGFFAIVASVSVTLFNTKGIITSEKTMERNSIEYGEVFEYSADAFLVSDKNVHYEFSKADVDEWSSEQPIHPGTYKYRAYSYNNYMKKTYGNIHTFTITPKAASISIQSDSIEYGEKPEIASQGLINGDRIVDYDLTYEGYGKTLTPEASVDLSSVKVESTSGEDRTDCYSFASEDKNITIKKKTIVMTMNSYSKIYDGYALLDEKETSGTLSEDTPLLTGDTIVKYPTNFVTIPDTKTEEEIKAIAAGTYSNTVIDNGNMKIVNQKNEDVTIYYELKITDGTFAIQKRPLLLHYKTLAKVYDGTELLPEEPTIDSSTSLAPTDVLTFENKPSSFGYKVGSGTYFYTPLIKDKNTGEEKTKNYDITYSGTASWAITKRKISIDVSYQGDSLFASDFRDGHTEITDLEYTLRAQETQSELKDKLGEGDVLSTKAVLKKENAQFSVDEDSSSIKIIHKTADVEEDVTECYEFVDVDYSKVQFKKKEINIIYPDVEKVYDGTPIEFSEPSISNNLDGDVEIKHDEFGEIADVCEKTELKSLNTHLEMKGTGADVTDYYELDVTNPHYTITKRPITISFLGAAGEYGNNTLTAKFHFTKNAEGKGLVDGHSINIVEESTGQIYCSTKNKTPDLNGEYSLSLTLDKAGEITFGSQGDEEIPLTHSLSAEIYDANGTNVTHNYEITYQDNENDSLSLSKRDLSVSFDDVTHYYDGENVRVEEVEAKKKNVEGLASNDEIEVVYKDKNHQLNGNDVLSSPVEGKISQSYDMNEYFEVKVSQNGNDVTDCYNIEADFGTLIIRRVQLIMESNSAWTSDSISSFYGQLDDVTCTNPFSLFKYSEESDFNPSDSDNELAKNYTMDTEFTFTGEANPSATIGETLSIKAQNYNLKSNSSEHKDITEDKIDFQFTDKKFSSVTIKRRTFQFSLESTKFYLGGSNEFNPSSISEYAGDSESEESNKTYAPYAIYNKKYVHDENLSIDDGKGLANGDRVVFSWKDKGPDKKEGTYDLADYLTWKILNSKGDDVTGCYQDENGNPLIAGDTQWYDTAKLEYKIPVIALRCIKESIEKEYDGTSALDAANDAFELVDEDIEGVDYPAGAELSLSFKNESLKATAGTYQLYETDLEKVSISAGGYTMSTADKENPLKVKFIEDKFPKVTINKKNDLSLTINTPKLKYEGSDGEIYNTNAYEDGKKWGLYYNESEKTSEDVHYLKVDVTGLLKGETFVLKQKSSALPSKASEEPYLWSDYYDYEILRDLGDGQDPIDVTENYQFKDGQSWDDFEFTIKKIHFKFSMKVEENYDWHQDDETSFTPAFTYIKDRSESSTDIHPTDFDGKVSVSYVGNAACSLTTVKDNIAVPEIKSMTYTYSIGSEDIKLTWKPDDSSQMELENQNQYLYYNVKKRKITLSLNKTSIDKVIYPWTTGLSLTQEDLFGSSMERPENLRTSDYISFSGYDLEDCSIGNHSVDLAKIKENVKVKVGSSGTDVSENYEITFTDESLNVEISKPKLVLPLSSQSTEYDGENKIGNVFSTAVLMDKNDNSLADMKVQNQTITMNRTCTMAGEYTFTDFSADDITAITIKTTNGKTLTKDDFSSIEVKNASETTLTIRKKKNAKIRCKNVKVNMKGKSVDDIPSYLKTLIKENKDKKYISYSRFVSGDQLADFDIVITDTGNNRYEYSIVPTSILSGTTEVISCYNLESMYIQKGTITLYGYESDYSGWYD